MSLNVEKIQTIRVLNPKIDIGKKKYAILQGPSSDMYTPITTTNIAVSQVVFNVKPQIRNFVNSTLIAQFPVRMRFNTNAPNGNPLLRSSYDAPRAFGLQAAITTITCNMGGAEFSCQIGEYIHALAHLGFGQYMLANHLSGTPNYLDNAQNYIDMVGSINNPLGTIGDKTSFSVQPRGSFEWNVVHNDQNYAVVDVVFTEEIFLSPWNVSKHQHAGFIGLQAIDIRMNFIGQNPAYRMFSHCDGGALAPGPFTSSQIAFNDFTSVDPAPFSYDGIAGPQLLMEFLSAPLTESIPLNNIYPLYNVQSYITTFNTTVAPNTSTGFITTNNIVFGRIPNRVIIFAREANQYLQSSPTKSDTFLAIEKINVFFDNQPAMLSSANQYNLWEIARENGCNLSFTEWKGQVYRPGSLVNKMGLTGSILPLVFGKDITCNPGTAGGSGGQYNFYFQIQLKNIDTVNPKNIAIYTVAISEGVLNINNGVAMGNYDIISNVDVLTSQTSMSPYINYNDIKDVNGGNVWTNIKHFGKDIWESIKQFAHQAAELYKKAKPYIGPLVDAGKIMLPLFAAGGNQYNGDGCDDFGDGCESCDIDNFDIPQKRSQTIPQGRGGMAIDKDELKRRMHTKRMR